MLSHSNDIVVIDQFIQFDGDFSPFNATSFFFFDFSFYLLSLCFKK